MSTSTRLLTALCLTGTMLGVAAASAPRAKNNATSATYAADAAADGGSCRVQPAPAPAPVRRRHLEEGCSETPPPPAARAKLFHHLRYHQSFPATRAELVAAMQRSEELTPAELAFITARLPSAAFASGAEALRAVFPGSHARLFLALAPHPTTLAQR